MNWSRQFSNREKFLLLVFTILLLFSLYYFFVFRPTSEQISQAEQQSEAITSDIAVLTVREERLKSMVAEIEARKAEGGTAAVPDYDNLQQLMGFLNAVFADGTPYNLSIQGVQAPAEGSSIVRRPMQMSFSSGSYYAARATIEQLQGSPFCCQIGSLSITPDEGSLAEATVRTSLTITFFENMT